MMNEAISKLNNVANSIANGIYSLHNLSIEIFFFNFFRINKINNENDNYCYQC